MDENESINNYAYENNEDLYALFKALQRQEEFLDIQVYVVINLKQIIFIHQLIY